MDTGVASETLYPDNTQIQYGWNMTQLISGVTGLSYSNVNLNMSMNSLTPNMFQTLFWDGSSLLSTITNWNGSSTKTLTSSLSAGTQYNLQSLIQYTGAQYDSLTKVPSFWSNPGSWIQANFWAFIVALAAVVGLGAGFALQKERELKVPK